MFTLSTGRRRRIAIAFVIGYVLAFLLLLISDSSGKSAVVAGDFPAFYTAGKIIREGQANRLYDFSLQQELQGRDWTALQDAFHPFAYPPFFALVFVPLAALPPLIAKLLYDVFQIGCLLLSLKYARVLVPALSGEFIISLALVLSFAPLLLGLLSGQNVALSLLLFTLIVWAQTQEGPRFQLDILAGLLISMWLFKPQYGGLVFLFFLIAREWIVCASAVFGAVILFLITSQIFGMSWLETWMTQAQAFHDLDVKGNAHQMVSFIGVGQAIDNWMGIDSVHNEIWNSKLSGKLFGLLLTAFGFLVSIFCFLQSRRAEASLNVRRLGLWHLTSAIFVLSPHTLFYDLGLGIYSFFATGLASNPTTILLVLGFSFVLSMTRELFPISPLFFYGLGLYLYTLYSVFYACELRANLSKTPVDS